MAAITKYGLQWPDKTDPLLIELALYARDDLRQKGRPQSKWEHLRRAIKMHLPDTTFRWHRWVDDFGEAWCDETEVIVWGAGGTTKSGIVGALSYFDLMAMPKQTLTVMVTNPLEKHWDRCFSKLLQWRNAMPTHLQIGKMVQSPKPALLTVDLKEGSRRGVLCISIDKGETGIEIGKKVGAHAPRTRLILEEGQTLPKETLDIATNLFMGSTDKKECIIGNPMSWHNNSLGEASKPMSGDTRGIDEQRPDRWLLKRSHGDRPGVCLVFDGLRCPTHDSPEEAARLSFMIQPRDIASAREKPGAENTVNFWSQIRGRIPPAGQILTVFSELDWDNCSLHVTHPFVGETELYTSADLSLGGDKIPIYAWEVGLTKEHGRIVQKKAREYIAVDVTKPDRSGQIGKAYAQLMKKWGVRDLRFCSADCSGQQGAIADTMERECHASGISGYLYRVRSEEAVTDRVLSNGRVLRSEKETQRERACDRYKDRATELVMNLVEAIQARVIWGLDDPEVRWQLTTRGFEDSALEGGAMKVQKKKEWREQNELRSPDELDAVGVMLAHLFERKILDPMKNTRPKEVLEPGVPKWMLQKPTVSFSPSASRISAAMRRR